MALGAALQAGVLGGEVRDLVLLDVTPLSLGIETLGGVFTRLIDRNTTIPTSKTEFFTTAADNHSPVDIHVLPGEREMAADNRGLGRFQLTGIAPAPRGVPKIEVAFDIDVNGIVHVSAKDTATGKQQSVTITASTSLPDKEVERLVHESAKMREEDRRRREEQELRNKADSLVYNAEKACREGENRADAALVQRVRSCVASLRSAQASGGVEEIRSAADSLTQELYRLSAEMYQTAGAGASAGSGPVPAAGESASSDAETVGAAVDSDGGEEA